MDVRGRRGRSEVVGWEVIVIMGAIGECASQ